MLHARLCQVTTPALQCNQAVALVLSAAVSSILSSALGTNVGPAFSQIGWHNIIDRWVVHWKPLIGDDAK
jgi:hypothetical protein